MQRKCAVAIVLAVAATVADRGAPGGQWPGQAVAAQAAGRATSHRPSRTRRARPGSNIALTRYFMREVFNKGNLAVADRLLAARFVEHNPFPGQTPDRAGFKRGVMGMRTTFPDLTITIQDIFASGDKVVFRSVMHGTQKGAFMGVAPTGRTVSVPGIDIVRIVHGRAVEHWGSEDDAGMMRQLGFTMTPPHPAK